jgi:hypothetical protein
MVVVAFVAYRYWRSTATFARQAREARARQMLEAYQASSVLPSVAPVVEPFPEGEAGGVVALEVDEGPVEEALEEVDIAELAVGHVSDQSESEPDVSDLEGEIPEDAGDPAMEETPGEAESAPEIAETAEDAPESAGDPAGEEASDEIEPEAEIAPSDETLEDRLADSETTPEETQEVPEAAEGATVERVDKPTPELDEEPDEPEALGPERTDTVRTDAFEPSIRLIEDLEPRRVSTPMANGSLSQLLKDLDEQLEALPIGIELMELPLIERRRVADRREDLIRDRARLLEERKGGAHRRRRRRRKDSTA